MDSIVDHCHVNRLTLYLLINLVGSIMCCASQHASSFPYTRLDFCRADSSLRHQDHRRHHSLDPFTGDSVFPVCVFAIIFKCFSIWNYPFHSCDMTGIRWILIRCTIVMYGYCSWFIPLTQISHGFCKGSFLQILPKELYLLLKGPMLQPNLKEQVI